eukprot:GHVR01041781.1.p2 GENE.GHVR01041781.1~~GHVR01041781.1.p2  ORF type:complete len:211 (+),score=23.56 GHVR01041781.1:1430-2062(+)
MEILKNKLESKRLFLVETIGAEALKNKYDKFYWKMQRYPSLPYLEDDNNLEKVAVTRVKRIINHAIDVGTEYGLYHDDIRYPNVVMLNDNAFLIDWDICTFIQPDFSLPSTASENRKNRTQNPIVKAILEASFGYDSENPKSCNKSFDNWVKKTTESILQKAEHEILNLCFLRDYFNQLLSLMCVSLSSDNSPVPVCETHTFTYTHTYTS